MSAKTYILIDSTYRNRTASPLPCSFVVPISQNNNTQEISAINAADPVALSAPEYTFTGQSLVTPPLVFSGGLRDLPQLNPASSIVDNYYNGYNIIDITIGQTRQIIQYTGSTQTARLNFPFATPWAATDQYVLVDPSTAAVVQFQPAASLVDNTYAGKYLKDEVLNEYRTIVSYNGNLRTATLDIPFSGGWAANNYYTVRSAMSEEQGLITGVTATSITLQPTSSAQDNYYTGKFAYFGSGPLFGQTRLIVGYNGTTKVATFATVFTVPPVVGDIYEILPFSYDNMHALQYTGSVLSQQETVNYEVQLISLELPNKTLVTAPGSRISYYPYVLVELSNDTAPSVSKNILYSNNPNAQRSTFVVPITDVDEPSTSQFISLTSDMTQTMRFKPNDNLRISVSLPNGSLFDVGPDLQSPLPPDPTIQIMAVFSIKRVPRE
jgi:hypothetical protein